MAESEAEEEYQVSEKKLLSALNNLPPMPDLSRHFNSRNAKVIATTLLLFSIGYHTYLFFAVGSDSCQWLLSDGRFQGSNWQPYGCMMHRYSNADTQACMHYIWYWKNRNKIVFLGDEHIHKLFYQFRDIVSGVPETLYEKSHHLTRKSFNYQNDTSQPISKDHLDQPNLGLQVMYYPFESLNEEYERMLKNWINGPKDQRPTLLVTGTALKMLNYTSDDQQLNNSDWKGQLERVKYLLSDSTWNPNTDILWSLQDPVFDINATHTNTHNQNKNNDKSANIQSVNDAVDTFNKEVLKSFGSSVKVWTSSRLISQIFQKNASFVNETEHSWLDTQILLNYKCNGNMYYRDGTCCTKTENPTLLQGMFAIIFIICMAMSIVMFLSCQRKVRAPKSTPTPAEKGREEEPELRKVNPTCLQQLYEIMRNFGILGLILAYFFLCDRTTFFMKENKSYSSLNFWFPLGYVMLIGLFWAKESKYTGCLHRDQTDEWKGWMQLVILIYHYTGASQILPIYIFVRCLVTTYIFLSAYGNLMYSYNTGDFSVRRFCKVMVRYNILTICLCIVMNRTYMFYYFIPLISFSYLLAYLTIAMFPRLSKDTVNMRLPVPGMMIKLALLLIFLIILYRVEVVREKIFLSHPIKALFINRDNTIKEWEFRWSIDRYSTIYGMLFGMAIILLKKYKIIQDHNNECNIVNNDIVLIIAAGLSVAAFMGYLVVAVLCGSKENCNNIHPFISAFPILGYIFLRNIIGPVRSLYSPFFSWFGKIALELFLAQYHIWLAADTNGILVLVPNYPILNVIVTSFIFVCAAHELHQCTTNLTHFLVPNDWKLLLRNVFIFTTIIVPVAIYSGAFNI